MSYTSTNLADATLRGLAIVDGAETPDTADRTYVADVYRQLWEELASHGTELVYWPYDDIPPAVFLIMRDMLMLEVGPAYGRVLAPAEKDVQRQIIERRLRKHTQMQSAAKPMSVEYF